MRVASDFDAVNLPLFAIFTSTTASAVAVFAGAIRVVAFLAVAWGEAAQLKC